MIRTLSIGIIISMSFLPLHGQITAFPYFQNFESFATCTNVCQSACPLSANWVNPSGTGDIGSWVVNSGSTPTSNTGPSEDADPGTVGGKYVYIESSNSCVGGKKVFLESPVFDFTNNPFPVLSFFSHLYGSGQGELHVDADTNGVTVMDIIPPIRGNEDQWRRNSICLEAFAGVQSVKFRFRAVTGFSETSDMAIDAVHVFEANSNDVYTKDILVCGDGIDEEIFIEFGNLGKNVASNVTARYSIDNGAFSPLEFIPGTFTSCQESTYTFAKKANFSSPGLHKITVVVKLFSQPDGNPSNDTMEVFVKKIPVISAFPYEEGFEQGDGGWQPAGEQISWAVGVPTGPASNPWISSAGEGNRSWVTNLTGLYNKSEYSFLESNCFDFSGMTADPVLAFLHTHDLETTLDLSWVEYSLNGGRSWQKLGDHLSGVSNWYNSFTKKAWTSTSSAGAGGWQEAAHRLTGMAGKRVRLRFVMLSDGSLNHEGVGIDRVRILNPFDLAIKDILSPGDNCEGSLGSTESITARVVNKGFFPVSGYAMGLKVDNQTYPVEPVAGALASGDSLDYIFSATGDFSMIGPHFIVVAAAFSGDNNTTDNQRVEQAGNFLPPDVNLGEDTVVCGGQAVLLDPGISNAQYLWSNNTTHPQLNVTSTGFYILELTDGNGCIGRDSIQVVVPPQLGFQIDDLEKVKCYSDSTGKVEIRILGGFPPYSLRWETGDTIRILEDLAADFYSFRVVDGFGCELIDSVEMIQNDSVAANIDALVDAGCPEDSTGAILITPTGGEAPFNYLWSNFSKQEDLTRIPEGKYRVSITDVNGCEFLSPFYQVVTHDTLPRANFNYIVSGGTVVFQDLSVNAVSYKWSFGDGSPMVSDPNPLYTYEVNDTFSVVLIASNSCGIDTFVQHIPMTTVSIETPKFPANLTLYPNPVVGNGFFLAFEEARLTHVSVAIMQADGKQLYREDLGNIWDSKKIHIPRKPSWAEGLYLVIIASDEGRVFRKVMFRH